MTLRILSITWLAPALALTVASAHDLTEKELVTARKIYDAKCVKCHRMYDPKDYSGEEWRLWMAKMSKKARLKPSQQGLLNRYWDAYRAEKPSQSIGNKVPADRSAQGSLSGSSRSRSDSTASSRNPTGRSERANNPNGN